MQCLMLIFFPMANVIGPNVFGFCMFVLEGVGSRLSILFLLRLWYRLPLSRPPPPAVGSQGRGLGTQAGWAWAAAGTTRTFLQGLWRPPPWALELSHKPSGSCLTIPHSVTPFPLWSSGLALS